ncbi:MAG: FtsW/RodA/SpoVE family cell cycle protein, partial [Planctomycetaceae bacterium]
MKPRNWCQRVPWTILLAAPALMLVGISGLLRGDELSGGGDFASRQLVWIALAVPAMVAATLFPYRVLRRWSYVLFAVSLLLLVAVYFLPSRNGARRWIPLGPMYFQPSELAKLAYILALSHYLTYRRNYRQLTGLLVPFALTLVPVALILREPDLGTSLLFLPVLFAMLFAAGGRPRHLVFVGVLGVGVLPALWVGMSAEQKS